MQMLQQLHRYPVKSGAPESLTSTLIEPRGMQFDRRWMIVDAQTGRFLTGREYGKLVQLQSHVDDGALELHAPDLAKWRVHTTGQRRNVSVWDDSVDASICDERTNQTLSDWLQRPVQMVHMDQAATRPVETKYAQPGDEVSFADGFPLLLMSTASIANLQTLLGYALPAERFRSNLIVDASTAHAEDQWQQIRIGSVLFDVVKPCVRCVFTTVDHQTGVRAVDGEPLRTLLKYRRSAKGVSFGMNVIARLSGANTIQVGDRLEIIKCT